DDRYNEVINGLKRHSWFFAAAGVCSLLAAGLPLLVNLPPRTPPNGYAMPNWLELGALAVFGLALSAAMFDRDPSTWRLWVSLCIQSTAILVMAVHDATIMIFPLLVLVAWQATLMMHFYGALIWVLVQTAVLSFLLLPLWNSPACRLMLGIFIVLQ